MEFVYTYIALVSLEFFMQNTSINQYIKGIAIVIFLSMGLYFLIKKSHGPITADTSYSYYDFFRGVLVGAMNMLIIPFWIFLAIWLESKGMHFDQQSTILSFCLGSTLGALLAFVGYIALSSWIVSRVQKVAQYTDKAVGILFLGLGVLQLIQIWI